MIRSGRLGEELRGPFDLSGDRKREARHFVMDTEYVHLAPSGVRLGTESYVLRLQFVPQASAADDSDHYTCSELCLQINGGPLISIPELGGWTYAFDPTMSGADGRGPLWGVSQHKFRDLGDDLGRLLPFSIRYAIYTNFIDFHSINDIFTRPTKFGKGIGDLKEIGQRIVHPASFIVTQVSFGTEIKPGSTFQNGEVMLELKGVSLVGGAACALVAYDAGESKLKMIIPATDDQESVTEGGSRYKGDIHVDLATGWVRKATLDEYLVAETRTQNSESRINNYTVRHIVIRLTG